MSEALITLAVLACPVGMGLMMLFMMRSNRNASNSDSQAPDATDAEITRLRAEIDQLRAAQTDAGRRGGEPR
ncbi:MAG: hypothetical protein GEV07_25555 [Streptosporangiales bacterium]|nr:hypothetical protein [Streptosporangiales bacterium]